MCQSALTDLDPPLPRRFDLDLQTVRRVRVRGRRRAVGGLGQHRLNDQLHHLSQLIDTEISFRQPPDVELMRLAGMQPIDRVAPVNDAGADEQRVAGRMRSQRPEKAGNRSAHVTAQQPMLAHVAGVARIACCTVGWVV